MQAWVIPIWPGEGGLAWPHGLADALDACACFCLGGALLLVPVGRRRTGRAPAIRAVAVLVLACSLAHGMALTQLLPPGWAGPAADMVTALLWAGAACVAWPLSLRMVDAPSSARLMAINAELGRLQASTAESNRSLMMAEHLAQLGHWRVSLPDRQVTWSDEVFRIYGLHETGYLPNLDTAIDAYVPEDRERVRQNFERVIAARGSYELDARIMRPNGEIREVRARGEVQVGADGEPASVFGVFLDITAQKQADAEKTAACEKLAAAQRMETLGQLAGGVAHDVNNVLQTIAVASGLIDQRAEQPAEVLRLNRLIGRTTDRAGAVVNRLLAFARRSELRAAHLDVNPLLISLAEVLNHTLGGAVSVVLQIDPISPHLWTDAGQLETVLVNLATNARDAMPLGGTITLAASVEWCDSRTPHHRGLGPGSYVRLSVTDEGTGMDEATLARAVEPFYTTKARGKGTGLGLSMASGFAAQSGGLLSLQSRVGVGTSVTIWLPQKPTHAQADAATSAGVGRLAILPQTFVLLVDDEPILRELVAEELAERGFAVLQASGAQAALELFAAGETVDLLVTDLSMPGMDGVSLIEAAQRHRTGLPAILLTGHAHDNARLSAHGAADCKYTLLTKPIRASELAAHVVRLLGTAPPAPALAMADADR